MRLVINTVLAILSAGALMAQTAEVVEPGKTGTVSGTVELLDGQPVTGAIVTLQPVQPGVSMKVALAAKSGKSGEFMIGGVPEGDYRVCVPWSDANVLDPCVWGGFPARVSVGGKEATKEARVIVNEGIELNLELEDPPDPNPAVGEKVEIKQRVLRPEVMFAVARPGVPVTQMYLSGASESTRNFRVVVPPGVDVSFLARVRGKDVRLELDEKGTDAGIFKDAAPGKGLDTPSRMELSKGAARKQIRVKATLNTDVKN